jgi:hypothetical protein
MQRNSKSFQIIDKIQLGLLEDVLLTDTEDATSVGNLSELVLIAVKMKNLCVQNKFFGLNARVCKLKHNLFIVSNDGVNFRCFINAKLKGFGETDSVESCILQRDEKGKYKQYFCKRYETIELEALELLTMPEIKLINFNEKFSGNMAVVIQNQISYLQNNLLHEHGLEVETY